MTPTSGKLLEKAKSRKQCDTTEQNSITNIMPPSTTQVRTCRLSARGPIHCNNGGNIISLSALMEGNDGVLGTSVATGVVRRSVKLMEVQPELKGLKTCMSQFMHGQDAPLNCDEIRVSNGAVLCAVLPWDDGGTSMLQTVRATSNFHGKPWYDFVKIRSDDSGAYYAQLRLLFAWKDLQFAFVRWLDADVTKEDDVLSNFGCVRLKWARGRIRKSGNTPWYDVIPLASIVSKEYAARDFRDGTGDLFHVSSFV